MVRLGAKTTIQTSVDPMGDPQADSKTTSKCAQMAPQGSQDDAMMSQGVPESETEDEQKLIVELRKNIKKPLEFTFGLRSATSGNLKLGANCPHLSSSRELWLVGGTHQVSTVQLGATCGRPGLRGPHGGSPVR